MTPQVLITTPDFPPMAGGIQLLLERLVTHAPWRTRVVCFRHRSAAYDDAGFGAEVVRVPRAFDHRLSIARLLAATVGEARRTRPDVILAGHVITGPAAITAARHRRCATIQYVHAKEVTGRPGVARAVLSRADATIAVSDFSRDLALAAGAPADRTHVILPGGGTDSDGTPPPSRDRRPQIVTVARLEDRYKGFDVMLRALPLIRARVADARWVVVGDGALLPELRDLAAAWGLGDAVDFRGHVDDETRDRVLRESCVFAMPSRTSGGREGEGFGIVYLEAGAAALPVVAGNDGGATSAVVDGVTGLLCDPRDHVAVADRVTRLLLDRALAQRLGEAGRRRQRTLSWARMANEVDAVVQGLVAR